eukprot:SAG31_NODE_611_length_13558_cov_224.959730_10_plen_966_part_00
MRIPNERAFGQPESIPLCATCADVQQAAIAALPVYEKHGLVSLYSRFVGLRFCGKPYTLDEFVLSVRHEVGCLLEDATAAGTNGGAPNGVVEVMVHPGYVGHALDEFNRSRGREAEMEVLCDARCKALIAEESRRLQTAAARRLAVATSSTARSGLCSSWELQMQRSARLEAEVACAEAEHQLKRQDQDLRRTKEAIARLQAQVDAETCGTILPEIVPRIETPAVYAEKQSSTAKTVALPVDTDLGVRSTSVASTISSASIMQPGSNEHCLLAGARSGDEFSVRAALRLLADDGVNGPRTTRKGYTALHLAAANGHTAVTQLLLNLGAEASAVSLRGGGWNPLHCAARNGHAAVIAQLCTALTGTDIGSAAPKAKKQPGRKSKPRDSIQKERLREISVGTEGPFRNLPRARSISSNADRQFGAESVPIAEVARASTAEVERSEAEGGQANHSSAGSESDISTSTLDVQNTVGGKPAHTALNLAALHGHYAASEVLLAAGADVNIADHAGDTPLFNALKKRHVELAKMLLTLGNKDDPIDPFIRRTKVEANSTVYVYNHSAFEVALSEYKGAEQIDLVTRCLNTRRRVFKKTFGKRRTVQYRGLAALLVAPAASDGTDKCCLPPLQALLQRCGMDGDEAALGLLLEHCACRRALSAVWATTASPALLMILVRDSLCFASAHLWGFFGPYALQRLTDGYELWSATAVAASDVSRPFIVESAEFRAAAIVAAWLLLCRHMLLVPLLGPLLSACLAVARRLAALAMLCGVLALPLGVALHLLPEVATTGSDDGENALLAVDMRRALATTLTGAPLAAITMALRRPFFTSAFDSSMKSSAASHAIRLARWALATFGRRTSAICRILEQLKLEGAANTEVFPNADDEKVAKSLGIGLARPEAPVKEDSMAQREQAFAVLQEISKLRQVVEAQGVILQQATQGIKREHGAKCARRCGECTTMESASVVIDGT